MLPRSLRGEIDELSSRAVRQGTICDHDLIRQRYNRIAAFIPFFEYAFFIPSGLRKRAVDQLKLRRGINRRAALGIIASASTIGASGVTLAKEKKHLNGNALLGEKIKQNGKHKIHTIGKTDVFAEVNNGKVVGVSAAGMQ